MGGRQAVQRPDRAAVHERLVELGRTLPGPLVVSDDHRVQDRVELVDARQRRLEQLAGRQLPAAQQRGELARRAQAQVVHGRTCVPGCSTVQNAQRRAAAGMELRHSEHSRTGAPGSGSVR